MSPPYQRGKQGDVHLVLLLRQEPSGSIGVNSNPLITPISLPFLETVRKFLIKCIIQLILPRSHKGAKKHEVQNYQLDALRDPSGLRDFF